MDYTRRARNAEEYLASLNVGNLKFKHDSRLLIGKRAAEPTRSIGVRPTSLGEGKHYSGIMYDVIEGTYTPASERRTLNRKDVLSQLGLLKDGQVLVVEPVKYSGTPKADKIESSKAQKRRTLIERLAGGED